MRHEGLSFYGLRQSDEGTDTDLIYNFCWPNNSTFSFSPSSDNIRLRDDFLFEVYIL